MNKKGPIFGGLVLLLLLLFVRSCDKKSVENVTNENLKQQEKEAIIVNPNTNEIIRLKRSTDKNGKEWTSKETIKGAREVRVSINRDGTTSITSKTKGFSHNLGLSLGVAETYRIGVDVEWAYWKQFGIISGMSMNVYQ